jgi:hypothetical protein
MNQKQSFESPLLKHLLIFNILSVALIRDKSGDFDPEEMPTKSSV